MRGRDAVTQQQNIVQALEQARALRQKISDFEAALAGMAQACESQTPQELGELRHAVTVGGGSAVGTIDLSVLPSDVQVAFRQNLYQAHFHQASVNWSDIVAGVNVVSQLLQPPTAELPPTESST